MGGGVKTDTADRPLVQAGASETSEREKASHKKGLRVLGGPAVVPGAQGDGDSLRR